jgi:hypothetical protein
MNSDSYIELERIKALAAAKVERDSFPVEFALALKQIRDEKMFYSYRCRSFRFFVKTQLPNCRSTTVKLMRIVDGFERIGYTRRQILELEAVSWAKLAEALPILTAENADYLILKAQTMRLRAFREFIEQAKRLTGLRRTA